LTGDGSGNNNFATTIVVASLASFVSTIYKKRKGWTKKDKKEKIVVEGFEKKGKRDSSSTSIKKGLVGSPVAVPLGGLFVNLFFRFS
jgi:hypothetical protein